MKFTDLWELKPLSRPEATVTGERYRVTVLTSRLFRLEYDPEGRFCDRATQTAICRDFPTPPFQTREENGWLTVETECARLVYDRRPFSSEGLSVTLKGDYSDYTCVWRYGDPPDTLGGTARTLDFANGPVPLEEGLTSLRGVAVLDDGASMLMDEEGGLLPAEEHGIDLYLFCYGHDFKGCLRDFYRLSGRAPILPRYALGNWWSRFYPYTEESYMELMERFRQEGVPLSVAVLDMNWHTTKIDPKYGAPWTGYTWDRECFPDPARMLRRLHDAGLRVTLNDHPADGVRACEELYPAMAREMGMDPQGDEPVPFDAASRKYLKAFEKIVLDDFSSKGVDFWWIDWQQKGGSSAPGVDPLFVLNHTRYLYELSKDRPAMTFSRYGGPGSHRYPVGFSGDTYMSWESLAFQPYFTATAANVGYGWWSHDIGGHMQGVHDDDLAARWIQFGVFSPVMRLHSSPSEYSRKEPWLYGRRACEVMKDFLRLRHRLLPWLYTQNVLCSEEGSVLLRPVYYDYACKPFDREGYRELRGEYLLGDGLLVCPIVTPTDPEALLGKAEVYLPEGEWTDFFNGRRYRGDRLLEVYRPLEEAPVFARAGTTIPMDANPAPENGAALPEEILLRVFAGADGGCSLIEDNGMAPGTKEYRRAVTEVRFVCGGESSLSILPVRGAAEVVPARRRYTVELIGVENVPPTEASCGYTRSYDAGRRALILTLDAGIRGATLRWDDALSCPPLDLTEVLPKLLFPARSSVTAKDGVVRAFRLQDKAERIAELRRLQLPDALLGALTELCSAE